MGYTLWNKKDILKSQEIAVDMTYASCSGQMHKERESGNISGHFQTHLKF